jgi:hypothetical protein
MERLSGTSNRGRFNLCTQPTRKMKLLELTEGVIPWREFVPGEFLTLSLTLTNEFYKSGSTYAT